MRISAGKFASFLYFTSQPTFACSESKMVNTVCETYSDLTKKDIINTSGVRTKVL